ncbi:conserved hypothetical protein [Sporisorium reilianum SRZ2]|uniref:Non-structural maintenance of chromosomes element 1 homolog n=1 Tax=Sporisorium reilianum (strain SRZ2) TaxID=999809 RepID=E6ZP22_SPORE|nr:conserved hypothetical protein [Sporisorium reilianum SRZ2]
MSQRDISTLARVSWLQSLISHRIVPVPFAKHLYKRCCAILGAPYEESAYQKMFDESTHHLSILDLEIRRFRDQQTGQHVLALVNTKADALIQNATRYTPNEIAYIKKLVEEIFKARREAYSIAALEAVRLGGRLRTPLTRDATQELLRNLVDHRWLACSAEGVYTLATRALLELRNYLQTEFEEHFHTCTHCKDVVTLGIGCSYTARGCTTRYHLHCARNTIGAAVDDDDALYRLAGGFSCSNCMRMWKSRPIGPRALNLGAGGEHDGMFSSQGESSQVEASRGSRRSRAAEQDEDDDEEEEDIADAAEQTPRQRPSRRPAAASDDDQDEPQTQSRSTRVKPEPQRTPLQPRTRRRATALDEEGGSEDEPEDVKPRKRAR